MTIAEHEVDMIASASLEHYRRSIEALIDDDSIDDILVIYIPMQPTDAPEVAAAIRDIATRDGGKTILATFMSAHGVPEPLAPVPSFAFPERAVGALARAANYAEWRRRPEKESAPLSVDVRTLRNVVEDALERGGGWLDPAEVDRLLRAAGVNTPGGAVVIDSEEAFEAAMRIAKPVALKAIGPNLLHKSDRGGVRLGLQNECDARDAFLAMKTRLGDNTTAAYVQPMIAGGVEVMLGATDDPTFGKSSPSAPAAPSSSSSQMSPSASNL